MTQVPIFPFVSKNRPDRRARANFHRQTERVTNGQCMREQLTERMRTNNYVKSHDRFPSVSNSISLLEREREISYMPLVEPRAQRNVNHLNNADKKNDWSVDEEGEMLFPR